MLTVRLLPALVPDRLVDLLLHRVQVEGGRILHRRVVDGRLGQLRHRLLDEDEPPELAGIEVVHVAAAEVVQALAADGRRPLERILADVHDRGHVGRDLWPRPALRLLVELVLEVVDADGAEVRAAEVEELVRAWTVPCPAAGPSGCSRRGGSCRSGRRASRP